jgi:hypothetical protein
VEIPAFQVHEAFYHRFIANSTNCSGGVSAMLRGQRWQAGGLMNCHCAVITAEWAEEVDSKGF